VILPFAVVEPFLFMIWGGVLGILLVLVVGPILHFKFAQETRVFSSIEGRCPCCDCEGQSLKPYLTSKLKARFSVICEKCGQTSLAILTEELPAELKSE